MTKEEFKKAAIKYGFNILISIDQLANTILGGDPDETISSRLGKRYTRSYPARVMCRVISYFFKEPKHCRNSIEADEGKDGL